MSDPSELALGLWQKYCDQKIEIERLHEEIKCEERRFNELWDRFAALDKTNQELVEALKQMVLITEIHQNWTENRFAWAEIDMAKVALTKATGESA